MIKNEDYYSHEFKVSFETWKKLNEIIAEIDNNLSKKYIKLNELNHYIANNVIDGSESDKMIVNYRNEIAGKIKGLIKAQLIIQNMIMGIEND